MGHEQPVDTAVCTHERQVQLLVQRSDIALRRGNTAGVLAAKMSADDAMAACQTECGTNSPYHGVELHPTSHEDAVAALRPSGYGSILAEEFTDIARSMGRVTRRLLRRPQHDREN